MPSHESTKDIVQLFNKFPDLGIFTLYQAKNDLQNILYFHYFTTINLHIHERVADPGFPVGGGGVDLMTGGGVDSQGS